MLQTFVDLRGLLASVRRVRATLAQLPPDESMAQALPPLPETPWELPPAAAAEGAEGHAGLPDEAPVPISTVDAWLGCDIGAGGCGRAVEAAAAGDLRLDGVAFSYPTRPGAPVLRDLTLTLPRGQVTAVVGRCVGVAGPGAPAAMAAAWPCHASSTRVGCFDAALPHCSLPPSLPSPGSPLPAPHRSGAGKSTIAALLQRLYAPDAGSLTLGGEDIRGFSRGEWCAALAAVSQEPVLFPASIAYNIGGCGVWPGG